MSAPSTYKPVLSGISLCETSKKKAHALQSLNPKALVAIPPIPLLWVVGCVADCGHQALFQHCSPGEL